MYYEKAGYWGHNFDNCFYFGVDYQELRIKNKMSVPYEKKGPFDPLDVWILMSPKLRVSLLKDDMSIAIKVCEEIAKSIDRLNNPKSKPLFGEKPVTHDWQNIPIFDYDKKTDQISKVEYLGKLYE